MNKILRFTALGLCAVALLGSCKKKGTEPIPTPQPGTEQPGQNPGSGNTGGGNNPGTTPGTDTPVDNTKGIKLVLAEGQTAFSISELDGTSITIEGSTAAKDITPWKNATDSKKDFSASVAGGTVVIKGNVTSLRITAGKLAKLDLSTAPAGLKSLYVVGRSHNGVTGSAQVKELDLSGAQDLYTLYLSNPGSSGMHDLSRHSKLVNVIMYKVGAAFTLPSTIGYLEINEAPTSVANSLTVEAFPKLQKLFLIGSWLNKPVNFSNSKTLTTFSCSRTKVTELNLSNCDRLADVLIRDLNGSPAELNLSGNTRLKETTEKYTSVHKVSGFMTDLDSRGARTLNLSGASFTKFSTAVCSIVSLTSIDLSNNKLVSANFSGFTALRNLNLLGNTTLMGAELTQALESLPKITSGTTGTLKITGLSDSDKAIVTGKGWSISAQ